MRRTLPLILAATLAGCGAPSAEESVEVASAWVADLRAERYEAACDRMEPGVAERLRNRFFRGQSLRSCPAVLRAYREALSDSKLDALRSPGLEAEPPVRENRVGVFPRAKRYDLEVLLMRWSGERWLVFSVGIAPDVRA